MKYIVTLFASALLACQAEAGILPRITPAQAGMDPKLLEYADSAILQSINEKEIPGAVLAVVRDGKMAYLKAYGNKEVYPDTVPMTTNTIFDMASCSKAMSTAVCTWMLIERGQLRLEDPVSRYIPGYQDYLDIEEHRTPIRIIDLLTHTSGLPPYGPTAALAKKYGSPNPQALLNYIATCKRDFKPETDFQYSCLNYITLQHIIENLSGMSLRDFARKNLFDVLGMQHTDYLPCKQGADGKWVNTAEAAWASVTKGDWHQLVAPTEKQPDGSVLCGQVHDPLARVMNGGISGNAGVFSCADDIALEVTALMDGGAYNGKRILSPMAVRAMTSLPKGKLAQFGRTPGWDICSPYASNNGDLFGAHTFGHTGYTGTSIIVDPDSHTAVILLTNRVHPVDEHSVVRLRAVVANAVAAAIVRP
jgi:CubicO group peptidase (beta-lactamase class C family)